MPNKIIKNRNGSILVMMLVATSMFSVIAMGSISLTLLQRKLNYQKIAHAQALHVAEAGVNYYRWVLYHDRNEYCNKEACKPGPDYGPYGPYSYSDASGETVGHYFLYITPPLQNGSTIVDIKSVGWIDEFPNVKRDIKVKCGIPSWSTYSNLSDENIRFGEGTEVWGPIHSNGGIRFDGIAHNLISSSMLSYNDPDHTGADEFGVHTHTAPTDPLPDGNNPPLNIPERIDTFIAGRSFPVTTVSFDLLNNYINEIYTTATSTGGLFLDDSGSEGYHITFSPVPGEGNDIIAIQKVTSVSASCGGSETDGITGEAPFISTTTPANGIIYIKDKVWVDGKIDNDRITIFAFKDPITGNNTDIIFNNDLLYTNYDGTDAIGLIAQRNISIGFYSEDDIEIDAALIAKEGRIGRNYFAPGSCNNTYVYRNSVTINGSLATRLRYGFAYTDDTGYDIRNLNYDNHLTFTPPPHFPSTGEYTFISWKEN